MEDSKFLRKATGRALARAGYDMSFAGDGEEALLIANDIRPDLILLDMILPKMSGLEILKALKKEPATEVIPVVVLTGLSKANAGRLRQDGAFGFLMKTDLARDHGEEFYVDAVRKIIMDLPASVLAHAVGTPYKLRNIPSLSSHDAQDSRRR